jgi:hypothetical protein
MQQSNIYHQHSKNIFMDTSNSFSKSFEARLIDKVVGIINTSSNKLFDLYRQFQTWIEKKTELEFTYREYTNASSGKKNGWLFLLFILLPTMGIIDYASIAQFIAYLAASTGSGLIAVFITLIGWLFFILLELATGYILIYYAKDKFWLRVMAIILAIGLIVLPSYLIYTTYDINPDKTPLLYHKTMALVLVSLLIHTIFFVVVGEVWAGIHYFVYLCKKRALENKHPHKAMKVEIEKLQKSYIDFDKHTRSLPTEQRTFLLQNRAWFVKHKLTNGAHSQEYDLSDYHPEINYATLSGAAILTPKLKQ